MKNIPDYFLALNKQYGLALNDYQAEIHAKAVTEAWYLSIDDKKQATLSVELPDYLLPRKSLFLSRLRTEINSNQSEVVIDRLKVQLQKTDQREVEKIISGYFRSLKVVLSNEQKFSLSELLTGRLKDLFILA